MERLTYRLEDQNGNKTATTVADSSIVHLSEAEQLVLYRNKLAAYEDAEEQGLLVVLEPEQIPSADGKEKSKCFYTDNPHSSFCLGYCHGNEDDEPINACKKCWWLDGNDDFRAEAEAALRKEQA